MVRTTHPVAEDMPLLPPTPCHQPHEPQHLGAHLEPRGAGSKCAFRAQGRAIRGPLHDVEPWAYTSSPEDRAQSALGRLNVERIRSLSTFSSLAFAGFSSLTSSSLSTLSPECRPRA